MVIPTGFPVSSIYALPFPMKPNYFVCTLGEAASVEAGEHFSDIPNLLETQAEHRADTPALGFYTVPASKGDARYGTQVLTFKQVYDGVKATANLLAACLEDAQQGETVALLSSSSPEFLFIWLACVWLGHPVLLIAPECSAAGIAHLCEQCEAHFLITDERNLDLGEQATKQDEQGTQGRLRRIEPPFFGRSIFDWLEAHCDDAMRSPAAAEAMSIAYYHHTSGTSSGQPKPIPQTHHGAVGVLPSLDGSPKATFTTTPLFHGGPADTFRAWTSNAMIWLFPGKDVPITARNIVRCLEAVSNGTGKDILPEVSYFGAVPYVLQMMAEDELGRDWLARMDLVSVGGAAMSDELGDALVSQGVNLVSRFGSAECGFLLSSHRDYACDKDWQYLRQPEGTNLLKFEMRDDGLSELIVGKDWPHLAKRNRADGSYATADLFKPHPTRKDAWKYHSRADAQLTLATGLKFDPSRLESAIAAATPLLSDVYIFGNQRPYPGALLFRSQQGAHTIDDDLVQEVAPIAEKYCAQAQSHAKLSRNMLIALPSSEDSLEKSSKGTVLRSRAEDRFAQIIDQAYGGIDSTPRREVGDDEMTSAMEDIIRSFLPDHAVVTEDTELFSLGIDSAASIQIRKRLQNLLPKHAPSLPTSVVEECGTTRNLAEFMIRARNDRGQETVNQRSEYRKAMLDLVNEHSTFVKPRIPTSRPQDAAGTFTRGGVVVMTGATGALGSVVLDMLRHDHRVARIYCLVRGADQVAAAARVSKALSSRGLQTLEDADDNGKVEVLQAVLSDNKLGLDDATYHQLACQATVILHLAWSVNFRLKLRTFARTDLPAVTNLINLAIISPHTEAPRVVFCSSVASVMASQEEHIPEAIIDDPNAASDTGYSQSKWVAEQICQRASNLARMKAKMIIARVGQLSGDTSKGIWNPREAWPLMLSTVKLLHSLPDLHDEVLNWLPLDIAASAMVDCALQESVKSDGLAVYHVLNDNLEPTWRDMLGWLRKRRHFEVVPPMTWLEQLEAKARDGCTHPAVNLLDHWRRAFTSASGGSARFDMARSKADLPALDPVPVVDEKYMGKIWAWIDSAM